MESEGSLPSLQESATCPCPELHQSSSRPLSTSCRFILILSSHQRLRLPNGLFFSDLLTIILYALPFSHIHAACRTHKILPDWITRTILVEEYISLSSSLYSFFHSPVTSSLLGPNILLSTLISNTLSLRSSSNVSGLVSQPYNTTCKIIFLYNLIFLFLDSKLDDKRFCTTW